MSFLPTTRRVLVALLASGCTFAFAEAAQAECANADLLPTAQNIEQVRDAVVCLHNEQRAERGLRELREHAKLQRAATGHSNEMVEQSYFAHDSEDGSDFVDRILKAKYVSRGDGYSLGENLAWGTGDFSTPRGVVDAWMKSPEHRANLLRRTYREIGIGIRLGVPKDGTVGATYTVDFGVRS
jgi:uncharacterized protein YkwD